MKRIFLTSGLVLCMACPAFADPVAVDITAPSANHPDGTLTVGGGDPTCQQPTLKGTSGTSTFTAQWTVDYKVMPLNENDGITTASGGASGDQTEPELYLVGGDGVYTRSGSSDANYVFTKVAANGTALTGLPTGIDVNFQFDANVPSGSSASATNMPSSTQATRLFQGYYPYGTTTETYISATPMITSGGALTTAGNTAADNYNGQQPWIAMYNLVHPNVTWGTTDNGIPQLDGYTFVAWGSASDSTTGVQNAAIDAEYIGQNKKYYAIWDANDIAITFNCAHPVQGAPIPGAEGTYAVNATQTANGSDNPDNHSIPMNGSDELTETCTLPGWTFQGWSCTNGLTAGNPEADVTFITASQLTTGAGYTVNMRTSQGVTCTARWAQNDITLVYDGNGATSGLIASGSCSYDGAIDLPAAPSRVGYDFAGWTVANTPAVSAAPEGD